MSRALTPSMTNYHAGVFLETECSRLPIRQEGDIQPGDSSEISVSLASPTAASAAPGSTCAVLRAAQVELCSRKNVRDPPSRALDLDGLPNEILVHILSYVDVDDLLSTSRVSHHFRHLSVHPYQHHLRLRNARVSLPHALAHPLRPSISELIRKRIYLTTVTVLGHQLARSLISIRLSRRLQARPSPETLVQRAVLWRECVPRVSGKSVSIHSNNSGGDNVAGYGYGSRRSFLEPFGAVRRPTRDSKLELGAMDPVIATRKRKIERGLISIRLSRRLKERPTPETLVERAVLWRESVPRLPSRDGCGGHGGGSGSGYGHSAIGGTYVAPGIVQKRREVEREKVKDMLRRWVGGKWKGMVRMKGEEDDGNTSTSTNSPGTGFVGQQQQQQQSSAAEGRQVLVGNWLTTSTTTTTTTIATATTTTTTTATVTNPPSPVVGGGGGGRVSRLRRFWESVGRDEGM